MKWEVFERPKIGRPRSYGLTITVGRSGVITLSQDVIEALHRPERVTYLWDSQARLIGVRPSIDGDPGSYKLGPSGNASGAAFLRHIGVPIGVDHTSIRRTATVLDDGPEPIAVIDLNDDGEPV